MAPNIPSVNTTSVCGPNYSTDNQNNLWISPNFPCPPFPGPFFIRINNYQHATWWDKSQPWLPYIPVFSLNNNSHHDFFAISHEKTIVTDIHNENWRVDPTRLSQWVEIFLSTRDICHELRRYLLSDVIEDGINTPADADYASLLSLRMDNSEKLCDVLLQMHDLMRAWIGYFNWLTAVANSPQNSPSRISETLKAPKVSAFCKFLTQFSDKLRGVCIDYDSSQTHDMPIQQWIQYNVPCYILLQRNGRPVMGVPQRYTIDSMNAIPRKPHSQKIQHFAIEQNDTVLKVWTPPKRTRAVNQNKRSQYAYAFFYSDFQTYGGPIRVYWYNSRKDNFANRDNSYNELEENKRKKNPYRILDEEYDSENDSDYDPEPYEFSDDDTHLQHQKGGKIFTKLIRPAIPPRFDLIIKQTNVNNPPVFVTLNPMGEQNSVNYIASTSSIRPFTPPLEDDQDVTHIVNTSSPEMFVDTQSTSVEPPMSRYQTPLEYYQAQAEQQGYTGIMPNPRKYSDDASLFPKLLCMWSLIRTFHRALRFMDGKSAIQTVGKNRYRCLFLHVTSCRL
jgi:hypothetical protein